MFFFFSNFAYAKDIYDTPDIKPINNQLYPEGAELNLKTIYFPIGAFNKYLGVGATYLQMLSPTSGWEVLSGYYFLENKASLQQTVIQYYGATAADFPLLKYLVKTGYSYVPFYSKSILFNSSLIHSRTYLNVSGGISDYTIEKPLFATVGYGMNFYFGSKFGFKLEIDFFHFFKKNSYIQDQLSIALGLNYTWGSND